MEKAILFQYTHRAALLISVISSTLFASVEHIRTDLQDATATILFSYTVPEGEYLYEESLQAHGEPQSLVISPAQINPSPRRVYDAKLRRDVSAIRGTGTITYTVRLPEQLPPQSTFLLQYRSNASSAIRELMITLSGDAPVAQEQLPPSISHTNAPYQPYPSFTSALTTRIEQAANALNTFFADIQQYVSDRVVNTQALLPRLMLVLVLGLLMSFTPCIYPMIPITVGILQASAGTSFVRNATLALSYTMGMASTFAFLGFLAATGSAQFGALLGNPIFVIILVIFLAYLAGSMLGLYDLAVPRFLQSSNHNVRGGSYISVFIFGALSGTVASPCLSPGLLLLLSIVATIGNPFLGFLLLFAFGMGLGIPLLIVGTFSNSAQLMPRAGIWMLEAKKIFGLLLLSMCCYYLSFVLPLALVWGIAAVGLFVMGVTLILGISKSDSRWLRRYKGAAGMLLIIAACASVPPLFKSLTANTHEQGNWRTSYETALAEARTHNTLVFADFGATWCSSCHTLRTTLLDSPSVTEVLNKLVPVYIDCTNPSHESCALVQKQFDVKGYPMVLLIDPETESVIARWSSELLGRSPKEFAQELERLIAR